jgi:hypothetical protein
VFVGYESDTKVGQEAASLQVTNDVVFDEHRAWKWNWGEKATPRSLQRR